MRPYPGLTLRGRYRLESRVAAGGMGEVWRALDQTLGRAVAVKVLRDEFVDDPTFLARFRAEARAAAPLTHPGIAQVYDYGEGDGTDGHTAYLVLELVPGEALSALLQREGPLGPSRTLDLVGQAADALAVAHRAGVIHRDVKPGNLLVTPTGSVRLTDFGIARAADAVPLTQTGTVMGTAHYLSPEQASGQPVTPASDIYSLGVVAYECLAGRRPFEHSSPVAVALAHTREDVPPLPSSIPAPVRELVMACLDKDPAGRPGSAAAVSAAAARVRLSLRGPGAGLEALAIAVPSALAAGAVPNGEPAMHALPARADAYALAGARTPSGPRAPASRRAAEPAGPQRRAAGAATRALPVVDPRSDRDAAGRPPTAVAGTAAAEPEPTSPDRQRGRRHGPSSAPGAGRGNGIALVGLVAVLLALLAAALVVLPLARDDGTAAPATRTGTGAGASAEPRFVDIAAGDLIGRPFDVVRQDLESRGLVVRRDDVVGTGPIGTVAGVSQSGRVRAGATIVLSVTARRAPGAGGADPPGPGPSGDAGAGSRADEGSGPGDDPGEGNGKGGTQEKKQKKKQDGGDSKGKDDQ